MNQPTTSNAMLFLLGDIVATPGALKALERNGVLPMLLLSRHMKGDWGEVSPDDAAATMPLLDCWHGQHDRLYSRLFAS